MHNKYSVTALCYLGRAHDLLKLNKQECLVYAALELRAGIETRMQEYLEAQKHISNKMKKGWKIAQLGKNIEKAFKTGDKITEIQIFDKEGIVPIAILYYTPVTSELRKNAQRLGGYLHALTYSDVSSDPWWDEFKQLLMIIETQLHDATTGVLLGPPILHKSTKQSTMSISGLLDKELEYLHKKMQKDEHITMKVDYFDSLPINARSHVFTKASKPFNV